MNLVLICLIQCNGGDNHKILVWTRLSDLHQEQLSRFVRSCVCIHWNFLCGTSVEYSIFLAVLYLTRRDKCSMHGSSTQKFFTVLQVRLPLLESLNHIRDIQNKIINFVSPLMRIISDQSGTIVFTIKFLYTTHLGNHWSL